MGNPKNLSFASHVFFLIVFVEILIYFFTFRFLRFLSKRYLPRHSHSSMSNYLTGKEIVIPSFIN